MASSSIGWRELPYARLPLSLDGGGLVWGELEPIDGHRIVLISGAASAHDVMRGEETQALGVFRLAGLKSLSAGCLLLLPGTHCKHLRIADGKVQEFHTFMTGELFAVISQHSILRHSVGPVPQATPTLEGRRLAAYRSGVAEARDLPLAAALFRVRTRQLLDGQAAEFNRAYLSGVLIGSELAYVTDQVPGGWPLVLSAAPALSSAYCEALSALGLEDRLHVVSPEDGARLSPQGQSVLLRRLDWI
jgi:2-dehydro-3-deoxygalactonokinase